MARIIKKLKSSKTRTRRIDKTFAFICYFLLVLYSIYLFAVWISFRPSLHINAVVVEGAHAVSSSSIQNVATSKLDDLFLFHIKRNNRLLYPRKEMENDIRSLSPRIAHVDTYFLPRKIKILITEYTPHFLYCIQDYLGTEYSTNTPKDVQPKDCYFADEDGYVYSEAPEYIGYPFVAIVSSSSEKAVSHQTPIGTYVITDEEYSNIRSFIDDLSKIGLTTHRVTLLDGADIRVDVGMPWEILFSTDKDANNAINNLGVVLSNFDKSKEKGMDIREIDLRFGNKIFYH